MRPRVWFATLALALGLVLMLVALGVNLLLYFLGRQRR